jgi:tRNA-specific 2-thiouridylase
MAVKAVALLSGGLDSRLAIKLIRDQGIDLQAVNFVNCFSLRTYSALARRKAPKREQVAATAKDSAPQTRAAQRLSERPPRRVYPVREAAEQLGVPLEVIPISRELMELVKHPRYGYGKNMNPCVDCRILTLGIAKKFMRDIGAAFMVTGEVLGQRPMSQRRDAMRLIDREADVEGLVLRPLTAQHLAETLPEREGWVDREKLLAISGRSRKEQIRLAELYGIRDYPSAAGGCLLTNEGFADKVRDLLAHKDPDLSDMVLLRVGRHFRLPRGGKAVVGKDKQENRRLRNLARAGDVLFRPHGNLPAPTALLRDSTSDEEIAITADLCISHSKLRTEPFMEIECFKYESPSDVVIINATAMPREVIDSLRI